MVERQRCPECGEIMDYIEEVQAHRCVSCGHRIGLEDCIDPKCLNPIGVYMKPATLDEKKEKSKDSSQDIYWRLSNLPRRHPRHTIKRLYVATLRRWHGYFNIRYWDRDEEEDGGEPGIRIWLGEWHPISIQARRRQPVRPPFQGFTYDVPGV